MELTLTDIHGKITASASFSQIKEAYLELFRLKSYGKFYVELMNLGEMELEIYSQSIVLIDQGRYAYDGPRGLSERFFTRYEEGTVLPILEELCNLLEGDDEEGIIKLLKTLPKPKSD